MDEKKRKFFIFYLFYRKLVNLLLLLFTKIKQAVVKLLVKFGSHLLSCLWNYITRERVLYRTLTYVDNKRKEKTSAS
jgi:hypothetical protein